MSTYDNYKDGASKSSDDGVCEMKDMLMNMSTVDNKDNDTSICADRGKEEYCNAACNKNHRSKHKKDCEEYAAQRAAGLNYDEKLFKQPPSLYSDCPICFERLPTLETGRKYKTCCGKTICSGCIYAPVFDHKGNIVVEKKCPFCRTPEPKSDEEMIEKLIKRVDANDPLAFHQLGVCYARGIHELPKDTIKALEHWHRAEELGCAISCHNIAYAYEYGRDVEVDKKKAKHYFELAAMRGDVNARYVLSSKEWDAGNMDRALRHLMIAARGGYDEALKTIQRLYTNGHATKEDYTKALLNYQLYLGEIKSKQRDKAAAVDSERYRYY